MKKSLLAAALMSLFLTACGDKAAEREAQKAQREKEQAERVKKQMEAKTQTPTTK